MISFRDVVIKVRSLTFLEHLNAYVACRRHRARVRSLNSILLAYNLPLAYPTSRELKLALMLTTNRPFDLIAAVNLQLPPEEIEIALNLIADKLIPYFDSIPKEPCKLQAVVSWNVTSLCTFDTIGLAKLHTIDALAHQTPVLLQETKWNAACLQRFRQATSRINTVASLAVWKESGQSGGVAICLPQDYKLVETVDLVPGFALAALVQFRSVCYWLLSVYWHPDQWGKLFPALSAFVKEATHMVVLGGDFNSVNQHKEGEYAHLLAQGDMIECQSDKPTFEQGSTISHLDHYPVSSTLYVSSRVCVDSWKHKKATGGHYLVKIRFRPKHKLDKDVAAIPVRTVPAAAFSVQPATTDLPGIEAAETSPSHLLLRKLINTTKARLVEEQRNGKRLCPSDALAAQKAMCFLWHANLRAQAGDSVAALIRKLMRLLNRHSCANIGIAARTVTSLAKHITILPFTSSSNGSAELPRHWLQEALNRLQLKTAPTPSLRSLIAQRDLQVDKSKLKWQSFRKICPRIIDSQQVRSENGQLITSMSQFDTALRATRAFWHHFPCQYDNQWDKLLQPYAQRAPFVPADLPNESALFKAIRGVWGAC